MNELDIFSAALDLADPPARGRYLDEACAGHPDLRSRIDALLRNAGDASRYLESSPQALLATIDAPSERVGKMIGPYKLRELLGEGGMGVVYVAEQEQPVRRKVALKIIKPGMDSHQVIARFEAEKQALAMMDHSNIAKVLDAGTTEAGRPYFVMELVRGIPITDFCDQHGLDTRQRLEIFIQVCRAIQHAHQKGIIHRDIKPSNVLVTLHDDKPIPKVIDFGIAKATQTRSVSEGPGDGHSIYTGFAQMLGTPLYMSPEQAELNALDIDTRSDVYSLGVLLYELLTGTTPFDKDRLQSVTFDEMRRIIREEEPETVSARMARTKSSHHAPRDVAHGLLSRSERATELDWIVMKALQKDRSERYESASSLAKDIERYLAGDLVHACPPSPAYRFRKFARKNKTALTTASLLAASLLLGITLSLWQALRATAAEAQASANEAQAKESAEGEAKQRKRAEANEQNALAAAAAEKKARQSEVAERKRAERGERSAKEAAAKAAKAEGDAKQAAAEAQAVLKFFQENVLAAAQPKEVKGLGREVTLREAINAAESKIEASFKDRPLVEASLRRVLGTTYANLFEPNLAIQQLERSQSLFKEHRGPDHADTLHATYHLGVAYWKARRTKQMVQLGEELVSRQEAKHGPAHANTIEAKNLLAVAYRISGQTTKGVALHEQLLEVAKASRGADDSKTLSLMNNVADGYIELKRFGDAIRLLEQCFELGKAKPSGRAADSKHANHIEKLATTYLRVNDFDKAIRLSEEAWQHQKATLGSTDITTLLQSQTHLGWVYARAGRIDAAKMHFDQVLGTLRSVITEPDRENRAVLSIPTRIAAALNEQKLYSEAESILREFLTSGERASADSSVRKHLLGLSLLGQAQGLKSSDPSAAERKLAEAEPLLIAANESLSTHVVPESDRELHLSNFNRNLTESFQQLVDLYTTWNKPDEAGKWQRELDAQAAEQPK